METKARSLRTLVSLIGRSGTLLTQSYRCLMLEITVSEAVVANESSTSGQLVPQSTAASAVSEVVPTIHRVQLNGFLRALKGRFIGVDFVKQDGSVRALNGRLGVHSHCAGGENKTVADSRPYLTVFDVKAMAYRTLNLATAHVLRANRMTYQIVG